MVLHNLQFQHDWHSLITHTRATSSTASGESKQEPADGLENLLPRPLISGIPPRRVYIHPDEQIGMIKAGIKEDDAPTQRELVLPSHLREKWSLRRFAEVFDAIDNIPPEPHNDAEESPTLNKSVPERKWRQTKRLLLATVDDDSTVVYYVIHDGIVKPRQN